MSDSQTPVQHVDRVEFEAALMQQEHRFFRVVSNYLSRGQFSASDPRRKAVTEAFAWRVTLALLPTAAVTGGGLTALMGLWIAWHANSLVAVQNELIREQNLADLREQTKWIPDVGIERGFESFLKGVDGVWVPENGPLMLIKNTCSQPLHSVHLYWHRPRQRDEAEQDVRNQLRIPGRFVDILNVVDAFETLRTGKSETFIENCSRVTPLSLLPGERGAIDNIPTWIPEAVRDRGRVHSCLFVLGTSLGRQQLSVAYGFEAESTGKDDHIRVKIVEMPSVARNQTDPRELH